MYASSSFDRYFCVGDICDKDDDNDLVMDSSDNCSSRIFDKEQQDIDGICYLNDNAFS